MAAYHADQERADGWTSTAHRQPKEDGWYLCLGIEIDLEQYGSPKDFWHANERRSQLSWLLWVREAGASYCAAGGIQEVLRFERSHGRPVWTLRNFLGNATPSGAESRFAVEAQPEYWRDLPEPVGLTRV